MRYEAESHPKHDVVDAAAMQTDFKKNYTKVGSTALHILKKVIHLFSHNSKSLQI